VTESGDTTVEAETVNEDFLDIFCLNRLIVLVNRALGDNHNALPLANKTVVLENVAHLRRPIIGRRRLLGNEKEVGTGSNRSHECEPSTVATHDLDNERTRVRRGSGGDGVDGLADTVKSSNGTDGQVRHRHVIATLLAHQFATKHSLDRSDKTDNVEVAVSLELLLADIAVRGELFDESRPLLAEHVGTGERSVTSTHGQAVNAIDDEVTSSAETTLARADWYCELRKLGTTHKTGSETIQ
jgi:hypothetical protein